MKTMSDPANNSDDLDFYALLEDLWRRRVVIFLTTAACLVVSVVFFWLVEKPQYYATTVIRSPSKVELEKLSFYSWESQVFGITSEKWLHVIKDEINNTELLLEAFNWSLSDIDTRMDWALPPADKSTKSINFYNDFHNRVETSLEGNELKLLFKTDIPNSGESISIFIAIKRIC